MTKELTTKVLQRRQAQEEHGTPLPGGEGSVHKPEISITKVDESTTVTPGHNFYNWPQLLPLAITVTPGHKDSSEENGSAEEAGR